MGVQGLTIRPAEEPQTKDGPGTGLSTGAAAPLAYKPHIDGLRAISIAAVVAFHAGVAGFGGGFVGVDIFFVISGFLIINQIVGSLGAGRFSILDFYARRALRILPSYGAMLLVTLLIAAIMLRAQTDLASFETSALFAPFFLTNFYFLASSGGYFDAGADLKPLLHTWSLAVEEQFYLVVPVLLVGLFWLARRRGWRVGPVLGVAAAAIAAASFIGCVVVTPPALELLAADKNPAFFMTWWRAWEFVAGGLVAAAAAAPWHRQSRLVATATGLVGIALVGLAVSLVGLEWLGVRLISLDRVIGYPGYAAALPVAGAMLVILSGLINAATPVARLLSLRPIVYLGQISYALYLWHWPLLVAARLMPVDWPPAVLVAIAVAASVLLALATRYLIELPILAWRRHVRLGSTRGLLVKVVVASIAGCAIIAPITYVVLEQAADAARRAPMLHAIAEARPADVPKCAFDEEQGRFSCDKVRVGVLVGDSHADVMSPRIAFAADQVGAGIVKLIGSGCNPQYLMLNWGGSLTNQACKDLVAGLDPEHPALREHADFAIVHIFWEGFFRDTRVDEATTEEWFGRSLRQLLQRLSNGGRTRILLMGPTPLFGRDDIGNCVLLADGLGLDLGNCGVTRQEENQRRSVPLRLLREVASSLPNVRLIDPIDVFCDTRRCLPAKDGVLSFFDAHHVNAYGSRALLKAFQADYDWAFGADPVIAPSVEPGPSVR